MNMFNEVHCGDCLGLMKDIDDNSIDMILCDLPYEVTSRNEWDKIIPMKPLWRNYRRIIKNDGAIVLTGQGLFSVMLISEASDIYKYSLIWKKNKPRGHLNANKMPLRIHEDILIFCKGQATYNPQKTHGHDPINSYNKKGSNSTNYGETRDRSGGGSTERHPTSILEIPVVNNEDKYKMHPTQKPVELGSWLVKTYTNEGDVVLDNACGSGSFLVAAKINNRQYIGMDIEKKYVNYSKSRLDELCLI